MHGHWGFRLVTSPATRETATKPTRARFATITQVRYPFTGGNSNPGNTTTAVMWTAILTREYSQRTQATNLRSQTAKRYSFISRRRRSFSDSTGGPGVRPSETGMATASTSVGVPHDPTRGCTCVWGGDAGTCCRTRGGRTGGSGVVMAGSSTVGVSSSKERGFSRKFSP